jgi:hypothetical protein
MFSKKILKYNEITDKNKSISRNGKLGQHKNIDIVYMLYIMNSNGEIS